MMAIMGAPLVVLVALVVHYQWRHRTIPVELPNGMILQGDTLVSPDQVTDLARDVDLICFDDRFVMVFSVQRDQSGLFDAQTDQRTALEHHPEILRPNGLLPRDKSCNGYYTIWVGPGLLGERNRLPFLPSCNSVNRANPTLKSQAWLERPCAER